MGNHINPVCLTAWNLFSLDMGSFRTVCVFLPFCNFDLPPWDIYLDLCVVFQMVGTIAAYFLVVKQFADQDTKINCVVNNATESSPIG